MSPVVAGACVGGAVLAYLLLSGKRLDQRGTWTVPGAAAVVAGVLVASFR